ncbi:MAG: tetratricopeptide repeat protein [Planctomycetes bacterium]|nr:tetratricopeptide repeat protein [Planctomycetota bacterium]MBI3847411.1 tetratricopeptide repeat protein [Planctomycetota bacterium]
MTAASDSLTDIPGLGANYRRMLARAGILSCAALRERCANVEGRKVLSWESGIPETLLDRWYRASFKAMPRATLPAADEGVTTRETEYISGPRASGASNGSTTLAAGPRLLAAIGEHRVFALGTLGVAVTLLFGGFAVYLRGLSRPGDRPSAITLESTVGVPAATRVPEAVAENATGERLFRAGDFEEARGHFESAAKIDSTFAEAWLNLGRTAMRLKEFDEAEDALRTASRLDGKSVAPLYYLGHLAMARGEWTKSADLCREALRLDRTFRYAWYDLGILAHRADGAVQLESDERAPVIRTLVSELSSSEPAEAGEAMAALARLSGASSPPNDAAGWREWLAAQATLGR